MIKCQLLKSHEEVVRRFGELERSEPPSLPTSSPPRELQDSPELQTRDIKVVSALELPGEEQEELNSQVARGLAKLDFPRGASLFTPSKAEPAPGSCLSPQSPEGATASPLDSSLALSPGSFQMVEAVPVNHKFKLTIFQPNNARSFMKHVRSEMRLLQSSLPAGIIVKGYEERMDLYSAMIHGPKATPYEDGVFFFDFQLPADYPASPPSCHYISYCTDRLNPNLYEDGKVCVSLLGTWQGKGTETWTPDSNLLQLLVSIQGLILVREPYFNEAGYEKQRGAQQGSENSRMYNEMAVLKLVQSMTKLLRNPQQPFQDEISEHFREAGGKLTARLLRWKAISEEQSRSLQATPTSPSTPGLSQELPDFPLVPASRGFCLSLTRAINNFQEAAATLQPASMELALD